MRLKEERLMRLLVIFASGLIIILTILTQLADSEIDKYEQDLFLDSKKLDNLLSNYAITHQYFIQFQGLDSSDLKTNTSNYVFESEELNKLTEEYLNEKISYNQYKERGSIYYTKLLDDRHELLNSASRMFNEKVTNETPWVFLRQMFIVVLIILAVVNFIGQIYIYIRKRSDRNKKVNLSQQT